VALPTARDALTFIVHYTDENGVPPSIRETAEALEASVGYTHRLVRELTDAGYLEQRALRRSTAYYPTAQGERELA
jgi:SOS-response transcriptional repressor LexA